MLLIIDRAKNGYEGDVKYDRNNLTKRGLKQRL